jgi:hypothetical protein
VTTELTAVNLALFNTVVSCYLFALIAVNSIRPTLVLEKFKTAIFCRELFVEIFYGIGLHVFFRPLYLYLYHIRNNPCCQGIIAITNGDKMSSWQIALMPMDSILLLVATVFYPFKIVKVNK